MSFSHIFHYCFSCLFIHLEILGYKQFQLLYHSSHLPMTPEMSFKKCRNGLQAQDAAVAQRKVEGGLVGSEVREGYLEEATSV